MKPIRGFSRRDALALMGAAGGAALMPASFACAEAKMDAAPRHGLSIFGELKYP